MNDSHPLLFVCLFFPLKMIDNLDWEEKTIRKNSNILLKSIRGLIVGEWECGETNLLLNFLLKPELLDCNNVGFQSDDFGINSDISIGEDGLHLRECVFKQSYYFLYFCVAPGVWSFCNAKVFKSAYLFYSFPICKQCFIQQCLTVLI